MGRWLKSYLASAEEVSMKNVTKAVLAILSLLSAFSCQSAYVAGSQGGFDRGIASATPDTSGMVIGGTAGGETLAVDFGYSQSGGQARQIRSRQSALYLGARVSSPSGWKVQPYVSAGVVRTKSAFLNESYDLGVSSVGNYGRVGVLVPVGDGLSLDLSYQAVEIPCSDIGGREDVDLDSSAFLVGFSIQF